MATNYEWLLHMDGEERQAWFEAEHVDAQSKAQSKDALTLSDLYGILSDENATCNNSDENVIHDSREKLEAPNQQISQSDAPKSEKTAENATAKDDIRNFDDSREKLEADVYKSAEDMERFSHGERFINTNLILRWLDRQAAITRKTEQAAWIQLANGLIHEANVKRDELRDELAKRNKGIERLKRQRDTARVKVDELEAECDEWKAKAEQAERAMNRAAGKWAKADEKNRELRKMLLLDDGTVEEYTERADPLTALAHQKQLAEEWRDRCHNAEALCDKLEAERDNLADDLLTCNRERERLRQALGTAIDHAHEITRLVDMEVA